MDMISDAFSKALGVVIWLGGGLASPADLSGPEQIAAATVLVLGIASMVLTRRLSTRARPAPIERHELDEAA